MTSLSAWTSRSTEQLVSDQLTAIDAWVRWQSAERQRLAVESESRDERLEMSRRLDALDHERRAVHERVVAQALDDDAWRGSERPRAVIAHRQPWFTTRLETELAGAGVVVVESLEDGAEAMAGVLLAQPELLIIGDLLPRVPALDLVERTQVLSPETIIVVQVSDGGRVEAFEDLGASVVVGRSVPTGEVVAQAVHCLHEGVGPFAGH